MYALGTLLMWTARALSILVAANLGFVIKRWVDEGQVWHATALALLLHALLFSMLWGLYRVGTRCRVIHCQATSQITF
jgi:hypothetical protein